MQLIIQMRASECSAEELIEVLKTLESPLDCKIKPVNPKGNQLPGASLRNSVHGKGHEEGGSAYAKAGSSLRSPPGYSRASTPQKPESAYFIALCSHL